MKRWQAQACLFAGMSMVGSYVALSKPLVAVMPVFLLLGLRFGIALLAMLPWLKYQVGIDAPLTAAQRRDVFLQSFFGNFLFSVCMLWGVSLAGGVAAGLVMSLIPAAVAVLSFLILRETIRPRVWLAVGLSVLSVALLVLANAVQSVSSQAPLQNQNATWGLLLLLGAVFCEAIYVIQAKRLSGVVSSKRLAALMNLCGFVLTLPFALWAARGFDFSAIGAAQWGVLVYYALAASMFSTWLWFTGLRQIPASQAGVFTIALPLTAAALGVILFAEPFGWLHAAAFALAAASVWLMNRQA